MSRSVGAVYDRAIYCFRKTFLYFRNKTRGHRPRRQKSRSFIGCGIQLLLALALTAGCGARAAKTVKPAAPVATLEALDNVHPTIQVMKVDRTTERAMQNYRLFLDETSNSTAMAPD